MDFYRLNLMLNIVDHKTRRKCLDQVEKLNKKVSISKIVIKKLFIIAGILMKRKLESRTDLSQSKVYKT